MNNRQAEETLSSETLRVACSVGPGCSLSTLWLPNLPDAPLPLSMTVQFVSLFYVRRGCTGTGVGVEGFVSLSQVLF